MEELSKELESIHQKSEEMKSDNNAVAKVIAAVVRNAMEDFHCKHLSDEQMKELNPIVRNAIYTALIHLQEDPFFLYTYYRMFVPDYWEDCKMIKL